MQRNQAGQPAANYAGTSSDGDPIAWRRWLMQVLERTLERDFWEWKDIPRGRDKAGRLLEGVKENYVHI